MESSSTSANSSFGSTASSSSPRAPTQEPSDHADSRGLAAAIKQEPSLQDAAGHPDNVWAHIFDENNPICLDVDDDDYPMDEEDVAADPRRETASIAHHQENGEGGSRSPIHVHDPTPSAALLDNWGYYDEDMLSPSQHHANGSAAMAHAQSLPPMPAFGNTPTQQGSIPFPFAAPDIKSEAPSRDQQDVRFNGVTATPSYLVAFEQQANGQPLPLSKPLIRDDGLLIVGTELVPNSAHNTTAPIWNRLFITKVGSSRADHEHHVIKAPADVRDLQWLGHSSAIAAIGSDIHVLRLAQGTDGGTLSAPLRRVHADTIRELAISYRSRGTVTIASGGFDETVVLTNLGEGGDPSTATMDGKIDAYDVVSSLRWHPTESGTLSWTTDGGDFQVVDVRARAKPQLQVALSSILEIDTMGGLFGHEYLSTTNVVLGFQSGQLLFLDLRKPRKQYCYGVMKSPLGSLGEVRRSGTGTCALFGVGGFATAAVESVGRELSGLIGVRPSHAAQIGLSEYKTSGDFSLETNSILAVSDNLGVVSVYDASRLTPGSMMASAAAASDSGWHERAV